MITSPASQFLKEASFRYLDLMKGTESKRLNKSLQEAREGLSSAEADFSNLQLNQEDILTSQRDKLHTLAIRLLFQPIKEIRGLDIDAQRALSNTLQDDASYIATIQRRLSKVPEQEAVRAKGIKQVSDAQKKVEVLEEQLRGAKGREDITQLGTGIGAVGLPTVAGGSYMLGKRDKKDNSKLARAPRDYAHEYSSYHSKPDQRQNRSERNKARRKLGLKVGDPREADHKRPISKGGGKGRGNLRAVSLETNRKKFTKTASTGIVVLKW